MRWSRRGPRPLTTSPARSPRPACARPLTIPAAELAVTVHRGAPDDLDRSYAALGRYLAEHDLRVEEPVREYYLVGPRHTDDANQWQTEIAWPVARTQRTP